jgi:hypothetical protein
MFRFTIRDVLWLTVVVAMGVGWYVDRRYLAEKYAGEMVGKLLQMNNADTAAKKASVLAE